MDRRVMRTLNSLYEALISLMADKDYNSISVEDICAAANVARSTFYLHFSDKDALHRSGFERFRHLLTSAEDGESLAAAPLAFGSALFEHARRYKHLHRALDGNRGGAAMLDAIAESLRQRVRRDLACRQEGAATDLRRDLMVEVVVGGYMAATRWWLDNDIALTPDEVERTIRTLMRDGLAEAGRDAG